MEQTRSSSKLLWVSLMVSMASLWFFSHSINHFLEKWHWLKIHTVSIEMKGGLSKEVIEEITKPLKGQSLLFLNPKTYINKILENPWVLEASFKKEFPDKISLSILSKEPKLILLEKNEIYYLDDTAQKIENIKHHSSTQKNLPLISFENSQAEWNTNSILLSIDSIQKIIPKPLKISQIIFEEFPYFRLYLTQSKIEWLFNAENLSDQIKYLPIFTSPNLKKPKNIYQINLTLPKKAVVRSSVSN